MKSTYTQEQMDKIDSMIEKLVKELNQGHTDLFKEYLKFTSKFHKYSFSNQILISVQKPNARHVASYDTWVNTFGRYPKKGTGIKILVPMFKKVEKQTTDGSKDEKRLIGYRVGNVFDISDTEGTPVPEMFYSLGDQGLELYNTLTGIMEKNQIKVVEEAIKAQGASYGGLVKIRPDQDGTNKFLTLIHEYAHELLHKGSENPNLSRGIKECQAEAVAYIVANYFGLESPVSSDYLMNWGNTADTLRANLEPVIKASKVIINQIAQEQEVSEENLNQEELAA